MKKMLLLLAFLPSFACAQKKEIGLSLGYNTTSSWQWSLLYRRKSMLYSLGSSHQNGGQKKLHTERKPNYGTDFLENGKFYWLFDMGLGAVILNRVSILGEISIGKRIEFDTFKDGRFKEGAYSLITNKKDAGGAGLYLSCRIFKHLHPYAGIHSIKKWGFGLRWMYGEN